MGSYRLKWCGNKITTSVCGVTTTPSLLQHIKETLRKMVGMEGYETSLPTILGKQVLGWIIMDRLTKFPYFIPIRENSYFPSLTS